MANMVTAEDRDVINQFQVLQQQLQHYRPHITKNEKLKSLEAICFVIDIIWRSLVIWKAQNIALNLI